MPPKSLVSSQSQRSIDRHRHGEHAAVHRSSKEGADVEIISEDPPADPNVRMAKLRKEFRTYASMGSIFPPFEEGSG